MDIHKEGESSADAAERWAARALNVEKMLRAVVDNHMRQPYAGAHQECVFCGVDHHLTHHEWCPMPKALGHFESKEGGG